VNTLLTVIVLWLSSNFDLPLDLRHPSIQFVTPASLAEIRGSRDRFRSAPADQAAAARSENSIEGLYQDEKETIYLREGWSEESVRDVSVLVHEMVHHLQRVKQEVYTCPGERERLAYKAQDKWLTHFGTSLPDAFGLDRFSIFAKTLCF